MFPMRSLAAFTLLVALTLLSMGSAPVQAQEALELPTYAPGDFWEYEMEAGDTSSLDDNLTLNATVDVTLRTTVEELTEITIEGVTHEAYRMAGVVRVEAESSDFNGVSGSGTIVVTYTSYVAVEGLETLRVEALLDGSLTTVVQGITVTIPLTGSLNATFVYSEDTWSFPLEEGDTGREAFNTTGDAHLMVGNMTLFESDFTTRETIPSAVVHREVEGRQSVSVPAGTFDTWVVRAGADPSGSAGSAALREYWSEAAGAPVQYTVQDGEGVEVAWVNLTSYGGAGLTILGVDAVIFIPSVAAVAVAVVAAYFLLRRRRPPQPEMGPGMPLEPPEAPETVPSPPEEGEP